MVAPRVVDAVRFTGGWLYDQVAAGWEVVVIVPENSDLRPLEILGVTAAVDLEAALRTVPQAPMPDTVAVAAELFDTDARIRAGMLEALSEDPTVITVFGETVPVELESRFQDKKHQLSRAAQVFKSHALAAASMPRDMVTRTEVFRSGRIDGTRSRGPLVAMA